MQQLQEVSEGKDGQVRCSWRRLLGCALGLALRRGLRGGYIGRDGERLIHVPSGRKGKSSSKSSSQPLVTSRAADGAVKQRSWHENQVFRQPTDRSRPSARCRGLNGLDAKETIPVINEKFGCIALRSSKTAQQMIGSGINSSVWLHA